MKYEYYDWVAGPVKFRHDIRFSSNTTSQTFVADELMGTLRMLNRYYQAAVKPDPYADKKLSDYA